ncbi:MAG: protein O-mannosyl-transferase family, partial [Vicinamibacteria bacterium]
MKGRWGRAALNVGVAAAVFASAFAFYCFTGPSDLAWMEGASYQGRVARAEIGAGPWDRPLFVFLSQPFLLLPLGKISSSANWAAAAFAAGACLFVYLLLKMLLQMAPQFIARRVGILAALSLGVSHTFWMRAVTPGPEPLDALLLAAILFFLIRFANDGGPKDLYLAMGILGLSLANNLLMIFLVPIVFLFVRFVHPPLLKNLGGVRFRGLLVFALGASIPLAVLGWSWWKSGFTIPEDQKSWHAFWEHMMLDWDRPLQESLIRFGSMLLLNFPPWSILIGLIGLAELHRRQKYVFWLVFPLFLVYGALAVTLELAAPVPSYLPAWVLFSVAVGYGWWKLLSSGNWQGFGVALLLCASPLLIYRYSPLAVRKAQMELRVEALLDVPKELPLDHLAFQLNPDRRELPHARAFAESALSALPDGAAVIALSSPAELIMAPIAYLIEVENRKPVRIVSRDQADAAGLHALVAEPGTSVFTMGLHPPNPGVAAILETHHFRAAGDWFQLVSKSELPGRALADAGILGVSDDSLGDAHLVGYWYGHVEPQGYPLSLRIEGPEGALSGIALLNEEGTRPQSGRFTRLSSTVGAVLGSMEYG